MEYRNSAYRFGIVAKFFHWTIALLVIAQFYLAWWTIYMLPEHSPTAAFYIGVLHKPFGILILVLVVLGILWRMNNSHPAYPYGMPLWEQLGALIVQNLLYLCLIVMAISGVISSDAAGHPLNFFGLCQFPTFMEPNKEIDELFFNIHQYAAYFLAALVVIHIAAAIKHHFWDKDTVLKSML